MDMPIQSSARSVLSDAILARDAAEQAVTYANKAVDLQTSELNKARASVEKVADQVSRAAFKKARLIQDTIKTGSALPPKYFDTTPATRQTKREVEAKVDQERVALDLLTAELVDAEKDLTNATKVLDQAVAAVVIQEGMALLEDAIEADAYAAELRSALLSLDSLYVSLPGQPVRLLLDKQPQGARIAEFLRNPPLADRATKSAVKLQVWRTFFLALATDASTALEKVEGQVATVPIPPPATLAVQTTERYEDSALFRQERGAVVAATEAGRISS
jgi:hypothetical protein